MAPRHGPRVLVAPQAFKGTADATEVAAAIARGVIAAWPDATTVELPLADGGEGTVRALVRSTRRSLRTERVHDPLGREITAEWGVFGDGETAVIEMASASGLGLLRPEERDPLRASTVGTGELLLAVAGAGFGRIIVGLGGSATNDGGAGFARAMGYRFVDASGRDLPEGGAALGRLHHLEGQTHPRLIRAALTVVCDVRNPLLGPEGATAVYGPQKGARPEDIVFLEEALTRYADVVEAFLGRRVRDIPGAGAAGGLGMAFLAFLDAPIKPGAALVMEKSGFARELAQADLVITGEGRLDDQSAFGKVTHAVGQAARAASVPVAFLVGSVTAVGRADAGDAPVVVLAEGPEPVSERIAAAAERLAEQVQWTLRLASVGNDHPKTESSK